MPITIHIYYSGPAGNARRYYSPLEDPDTLLLIDSWADQQALDRHHASPMMETIAQLREKYQLTMEVERFVSDEGGIPASDRAFLV